MLRFRLLGIPVEVQTSHLITSLVFALLFVDQQGPSSRWPGTALADPGTRLPTLLLCVGLWVLIFFVSVLVHEMGHALSCRAFGYQPSITLVALGGLTEPNAPGAIPWHKDVLLTLAGPLAGLLLGLGCGIGAAWSADVDVARYALQGAALANFFWTFVNLLPVFPLDGGRVSQAVFMRLFARRGFLFAQGLSLLVALAVVFWAVQSQGLFLALYFGLYGFRSLQLMQAYFRGEMPPSETDEQTRAAFQKAQAFMDKGDYAQADAELRPLLSLPLPTAVLEKAHHALGWLRLKEARGPEALEHFSKAPPSDTEPHALAAAYSLSGDDLTALPLWEKAHGKLPNATLLHEWAGTLLRLGEPEAVDRMPNVERPFAYTCAERVLFLRGDFRRAAQMGEEALALFPDPVRAYDTACAHARAGDVEAALRLLNDAKRLGFNHAEQAAGDPDLDALRPLPAFQAWLSSLRENARR